MKLYLVFSGKIIFLSDQLKNTITVTIHKNSQIMKCFSTQCKMVIKKSKCDNNECPTVYENKFFEPDYKFDIRLNITDHTGSLLHCRFAGNAVEEALQCSVSKIFYLEK